MIHFAHARTVFLLVIVISGCVARHNVFDRAVIRNETHGIVSQVKVQHEPTGKFGEVGSILPQTSFELGFSAQRMLARRAIVTWTGKGGQVYRVETSLPQSLPKVPKGQSLDLVYTIHPAGTVTVGFEE